MGDTGVCQSRTMSRVTATQASWVKKWKKPRWCGKVPATRAGFIVCMKAFYIECFWMWIGYVCYCLAINSWSTWGGGCQSLSCEFSCYPAGWPRPIHPRPSTSPCLQVYPLSPWSDVISLSFWACQVLLQSKPCSCLLVQCGRLYIPSLDCGEVGRQKLELEHVCSCPKYLDSSISPPIFYKPRTIKSTCLYLEESIDVSLKEILFLITKVSHAHW